MTIFAAPAPDVRTFLSEVDPRCIADAVARGWQPIAHRCELANDGDYVVQPWRTDGEVAIANMAGEIVAWDNRCPHRGARIYTAAAGNAPPRCAYHGRMATATTVRRFALAERGGFFFVADRPFGGAPLLPFDIPPLTLDSTLTYTMDCHWTGAVENALDYEHVEVLHAGSLGRLALTPLTLQTFSDGSSVQRFASSADLDRLARFFPHTRDFDYVHAHFFPYSAISSTRGWTYSLQHYWPRADGRTTFVHRLYVTETTRPMRDFFDSVAAVNAQTFAEDAAICARVPAGHASELGPHDARIAHFRRFL